MEWKTEPENEQQDNETGNNKLVTLLHLRLPLPRLPSLWPGRRGSFLALCHRAPVHPPPPWSLDRTTVLLGRFRRCRRGRSYRYRRQFHPQCRGCTCPEAAARICRKLRKSRWEARLHCRAKARRQLSVESAPAYPKPDRTPPSSFVRLGRPARSAFFWRLPSSRPGRKCERNATQHPVPFGRSVLW